jgi:hypothetical protein
MTHGRKREGDPFSCCLCLKALLCFAFTPTRPLHSPFLNSNPHPHLRLHIITHTHAHSAPPCLFSNRPADTQHSLQHTHTHTHIYIYIYICIGIQFSAKSEHRRSRLFFPLFLPPSLSLTHSLTHPPTHSLTLTCPRTPFSQSKHHPFALFLQRSKQ